jgi:hypothetical protein
MENKAGILGDDSEELLWHCREESDQADKTGSTSHAFRKGSAFGGSGGGRRRQQPAPVEMPRPLGAVEEGGGHRAPLGMGKPLGVTREEGRRRGRVAIGATAAAAVTVADGKMRRRGRRWPR